MAEFYRVREAFAFTDHRGVPRVCSVGEILSSDDPDLRGREALCDKLSDFVSRAPASETASAAPGEVRARRPYKKAALKFQPAPVPPVDPAPAVVVEPESEL